nr:hypothetical protein [Tanacetum cinerariifolium]
QKYADGYYSFSSLFTPAFTERVGGYGRSTEQESASYAGKVSKADIGGEGAESAWPASISAQTTLTRAGVEGEQTDQPRAPPVA